MSMQNLNKIHQKLFKLQSENQALTDGQADGWMDTQWGRHNTPPLSCGGV